MTPNLSKIPCNTDDFLVNSAKTRWPVLMGDFPDRTLALLTSSVISGEVETRLEPVVIEIEPPSLLYFEEPSIRVLRNGSIDVPSRLLIETEARLSLLRIAINRSGISATLFGDSSPKASTSCVLIWI